MSTARDGGLDLFAHRLHPGALSDIAGWAEHDELRKLQAALQSHTSEEAFFDSYAEALLARHLIGRGCQLRFEVPNPSGKQCDFEVTWRDRVLYVHVKRIHSERDLPRQLTISPRLRYLERIRRPYIVGIRWHEGLTDEQMQHYVARATAFIGHARVGDELTVLDERDGGTGAEIGGVRIVAPWSGTHISLAIDLPSGHVDETPRVAKLLSRAYQQFMPKAMNVIVICSMNPDTLEDFQAALLGAHIERWDTVPPRGRRVAHGRAADGFWSGGRYAESVVATWFGFEPGDDGLAIRRWHRKGVVIEQDMHEMIAHIFDPLEQDQT
ncbi:MAG: hypothetical protein ACYTGR_02090 [Planctomycetota bacterium]|jgi:hypothetical protein